MIGFVTDSNAQLPAELVERYDVEVVPLTVTIDGTPYLEGVDIDADGFYERFESGQPEVSTSQPSPGPVLGGVRASRGARRRRDPLRAHRLGGVGHDQRGSPGSPARARKVRLVDTGTASFGVACCLWEAAEAVMAGASLEEAAQVAEQVGSTVDNIFVVQALDLARAGGRLSPDARVGDAIPVLRLVNGVMETVGEARDLDEAAEVMASFVQAWGTALRVGVGVADAGTRPLGEALASRLAAADEVLEVVRYRVGPSVGVHTGPGTVGACYYPARNI